MGFFRNVSVTRMIMLTSGVAVLLACAVFIVYDLHDSRKTETRELSSLANIVGANSIAPLEFNDAESGKEVMESLVSDSRVLSAGLYSQDGRLFAFFNRGENSDTPIPLNPLEDSAEIKNGRLLLYQGIAHQNQRIGTIYLQAKLQSVFDLAKKYGILVAMVFGCSLLITFLISSKLQAMTSNLMAHLADTAKKVSAEKDYSLRVTKKDDDEFGFLVDRFNEILDQIQGRDIALNKTKTELDERIKERTRDLQTEINVHKRKESLIVGQNLTLEKLALGKPLKEILDAMTTGVEKLLTEAKCSIFLLDPSGQRLFHSSSPSLPPSFIEKSDGFPVGPQNGSCGAAVCKGELIIAENIEFDPLWAERKDLALSHGLRASWSCPISGSEEAVLGTFAIFYGRPRRPTEEEIDLIKSAAHLAGIAIEHKKAEEKLKDYAAELERSNQALQDFASIASHDLQEPLRKIITFGDRLISKLPTLDEQGKDYMDRMQNAALRMQRFINDLLLYSRVTSKGKSFGPVDFKKLVGQAVEDLELAISRTKGTVTVGELPTLEADVFQIRQLFQNLIGNALKYHQSGVLPQINVESCYKNNGLWEITVKDNGIGFDEKHNKRIFKPFERLHGRSSYEGTGMGLAICKKIVNRHGGDIVAHSQPQEGSSFVITLPEKQAKK